MSLSGPLRALLDEGGDPVLRGALSEPLPESDITAPPALRAFLAAGLAAEPPLGPGRTVLAVIETGRAADELAAELRSLLAPGVDPSAIAEYPDWESLPHERPLTAQRHRRAPARRSAKARPSGRRGPHQQPSVDHRRPGVRGAGAPGRRAGRSRAGPPRGGGEIALEDLARRLAAAAYRRVDLVERRGEFAVRGGLIDFFPPTEEHPPRLRPVEREQTPRAVMSPGASPSTRVYRASRIRRTS